MDRVGPNYWCSCWRLGMDKKFHPTFYRACYYISMLGLKLVHASKAAPVAIHIGCSCWTQNLLGSFSNYLIMTSCHENAVRDIGALWGVGWGGVLPFTRGYPHEGLIMRSFDASLLSVLELAVEPSIELLVIWDAVTPTWRHCDALVWPLASSTIHTSTLNIKLNENCRFVVRNFKDMARAEQATSHYLNQWWPRILKHICATRPPWVK